jgi:WD40 repeat protein
MTAEEHLAALESRFSSHALTAVERSVFLGVWRGQSYAEIAKETGYNAGYIKLVSHKLWHKISELVGEKVSKSNLPAAVRHFLQQQAAQTAAVVETQLLTRPSQQDWGEVADVSVFYGRGEELTTLEQWIEGDRCRLVAIHGIGGLGKTSLSVKMSQNLQSRFEFLSWRSFNNVKPPSEILAQWIHLASGQQETEFGDDVEDLLSRLLEYLRRHRCLLVIDNFESVLQGGEHVGTYNRDYEQYGLILRRLGEVSHHSCLVVTTRELPSEIANLEGDRLPVRVLRLTGLEETAAEQMLAAKGLTGDRQDIHRLVEWYRGNPLALKIAATSIKEIFADSINRFLDQRTISFSGVSKLLEQQFKRLSAVEKQVMYWLAINREPCSDGELQSDIVPQVEHSDLMQALSSLRRRSLLEQSGRGFTQQPVVMEYVSTLLVEQFYYEISQDQPIGVLSAIQARLQKQLFYLRHYALVKASAKDYIRQSQERVLLEPLISKLLTKLETKEVIAEQINDLLLELRRRDRRNGQEVGTDYAAGNMLNLLGWLKADLRGADFSAMPIRQAYLAEVPLHNVSFRNAKFQKTVFAEVIGGVLCTAFSPDGQQLAVGDSKGEIHLWRVRDGRPLLTLKGHSGWVSTLSFSPDSSLLVSGSYDQTLKVWDVQSGTCLRTLRGFIGQVTAVVYSPDGQFLASGHVDRSVRLWHAQSQAPMAVLQGHTDIVSSVAIHPQGALLASGSDDQTIRLWDLGTLTCARVLTGHDDLVWSVDFNHNGNVLASGSEDQTIRLWNVETGNCLRVLTGHRHTVFAVRFSGQLLASGSGDRTIRLWNPISEECVKTLYGHRHWVRSIACHPRGELLASCSGDALVKMWEVRSGQCVRTFQGHFGLSNTWAEPAFGDVQSSNDHLLSLWEVKNGQQFRILQGYSNAVWSVALHPRGDLIASGGDDSILRLWHLPSGTCIQRLMGHGGRIWQATFAPDGEQVATCSEDGTVRLWHTATGESVAVISIHPNLPRSLCFSQDGQFLAIGDTDRTIRLWHRDTQTFQRTLEGHQAGVQSLAFAEGDRYLISGSRDKTVAIWDVAQGTVLHRLTAGLDAIHGVAYCPVHNLVAIASSALHLWHLPTQTPQGTLTDHDGMVLSVAMTHNGTLMVSGGSDRTLRIWDLPSGALLHTIPAHKEAIYAIAMGPDNNQLFASGSRDETIKVWSHPDTGQPRTLREPRLYEGLDLSHASGLTLAQRTKLEMLGARITLD